MSKETLGSVRQSAVLMNYGPGAIVDFRTANGAAVSVMAGGLEYWEDAARNRDEGADDIKRFVDKRLCTKLDVDHLRFPPVASTTDLRGGTTSRKRSGADDVNLQQSVFLPAKRFPNWLQCTVCGTVKPSSKWGTDAGGSLSPYCTTCGNDERRVFALPVRFVVACRHGHIDEFPWAAWAHKDQKNCGNDSEFRLEVKGAGLKGMTLVCPKCNAAASMEHIFKVGALPGDSCAGKRPWLRDSPDEECGQTVRVMQRGASNLYFPLTLSALTIPPWSEKIIQLLGVFWDPLQRVEDPEDRRIRISQDWDSYPRSIKSMGQEAFIARVEGILSQDSTTTDDLRWDEYRQLTSGSWGHHSNSDFVVEQESTPHDIASIAALYRVKALREIRVLRGFSRIEAPPGSPPVRKQNMRRNKPNWYPAIEVRGEGIFFSIEEEMIARWSQKENVIKRAEAIENPEASNILNPDNLPNHSVTPPEVARYLFLHSLAHVLIKQLSLQCGYSSASLRERIYTGVDATPMAGILIFTGSSDSDGTLGGLQRQGLTERFIPAFKESLLANMWCSSDPLCLSGAMSQSEPYNLAACHSCLQLPETCCEEHNRFLDRAMLYGTEEDEELGFFTGEEIGSWLTDG